MDSSLLKALLINRMLGEGYLVSTTIYPTLKHQIRDIRRFLKSLRSVVEILSWELVHDQDKLKEEALSLGPLQQGFGRAQKL